MRFAGLRYSSDVGAIVWALEPLSRQLSPHNLYLLKGLFVQIVCIFSQIEIDTLSVIKKTRLERPVRAGKTEMIRATVERGGTESQRERVLLFLPLICVSATFNAICGIAAGACNAAITQHLAMRYGLKIS